MTGVYKHSWLQEQYACTFAFAPQVLYILDPVGALCVLLLLLPRRWCTSWTR